MNLSRTVFLSILCFSITELLAQQNSQTTAVNTWFMNTIQVQFNPKWTAGLEFHERTAKPFASREKIIFRPTVEYALKPQTSIGLGYSYVQSFFYSSDVNSRNITENNVWEQMILGKRLNNWLISSRIRLEHRWITPENQTGNFQNRMRCMLMLRKDFPIKNGFEIISTLRNEFFLSQNSYLIPQDWASNWLATGIGWGYKKRAEMLFSYQHQTLFASNNLMIHSPTFWLTVLSKFELKKRTEAPKSQPIHEDSF